MKLATLIVVCLAFINSAHGSLRIVATGDSNTAYAPARLQNSINNESISGGVALSVNSGGATTKTYLGQEVDVHQGVAHNFAFEALNGPAKNWLNQYTVSPEPDAVIVMIGTNDAIRAATNPAWIQTFQDNLLEIYDFYSANTTPSGKQPKIFAATVLPILSDPNNPANAISDNLINEVFNPYIKSTAATYGFNLIDVNAKVKSLPNWQSYYSDDGINPGHYHLWFNNGYQLLADFMLSSVLDSYAGDANLDGTVNGVDYITWAANFKQQSSKWSNGDFNHDGVVDGIDYIIWANNFRGATSSAFPVPEPSGVALLIIAFFSMLLFRVRLYANN